MSLQLGSAGGKGPEVLGIPIEFFLFGFTLAGVALFHKRALWIAVGGMLTVLAFKFLFTDFNLFRHLWGHSFVRHMKGDPAEHGELRLVLNLLGLLLGFSLLAKHFEDSRIPEKLPSILPAGWKGAFALLFICFVMSAFLDNIAAAMIGGTMARHVFKGKVHIGYLAAIVAASNAGGAGSVVGDTTTTMMWIDGVKALDVVEAFVGAGVAFLFLGAVGATQQHRLQPLSPDVQSHEKVDWVRVLIVGLILAGTIATNILLDFPALGVWAAILLGALLRKTAWYELPGALKGSCFLLSLVLAASMMPVDKLPPASWSSTFGLGFLSSVFDNIPLTRLALAQGGYDWATLAYAVGYGGSMVWFGSSAGVAITIAFPEGRSVFRWLKAGWHVIVAYVLGFFAMLLLLGWKPTDREKDKKKETHPPEVTAPHHP